jgi:triphosphatase
MIDGTPLEGTITKKIRRRLKPMFETRIRRTTYPFVNKERAVELTIDRGKIDSCDVSVPVCELELELKRGSKSQLFEVARTLTHTLPAQVSLKSKAERGYELVEGSKNLPAKAVSLHFGDGCSARDGFPVIGFACLKQIVCQRLPRQTPIGTRECPLLGVKRTWLLQCAMSAFDPKRTLSGAFDSRQ